jgi:predicted transcriptional regulator
MVAPDYAARRSDLAKSLGLGRKPKTEAPPAKTRGRKASAKSATSAA